MDLHKCEATIHEREEDGGTRRDVWDIYTDMMEAYMTDGDRQERPKKVDREQRMERIITETWRADSRGMDAREMQGRSRG